MELVTWPASDYSGNYGTGYLGQTLEGEELKFKVRWIYGANFVWLL